MRLQVDVDAAAAVDPACITLLALQLLVVLHRVPHLADTT